jgi:hypothetical protein
MMKTCTILVLVLACRGGGGDRPPCTAVGGRFFVLAREELAKASAPDDVRRGVLDQLPAMRDSLVQACREGAWSAGVRDCMVRAVDHAALEACERALTEQQLRELDRAARGSK